jgi:23S rRNA pseudouridine2605 synthase
MNPSTPDDADALPSPMPEPPAATSAAVPPPHVASARERAEAAYAAAEAAEDAAADAAAYAKVNAGVRAEADQDAADTDDDDGHAQADAPRAAQAPKGPADAEGERRHRGPHGRRRRVRGERPVRADAPAAAPASEPGTAAADAPAVELGEAPPLAMAEQPLDPAVLERGRRAAKVALDAQSDKLHKVLADAGVGSRRDMEELIVAGRVSVNGQPAHVGQRVLPTDQVRINGKPLNVRRVPGRPPRVLLYHKPAGEIVSQDDPQARPSVFAKLPKVSGGRWIAVGRLDFNTEGLLVLTTSGELANRLMHPRFEVEREYAVRLLGELTPEQHGRLLEGIELEDGPARFSRLEDAGGQGVNHWYRVVIAEGRNREVRRIFEALGMQVSRLIRIRYGAVQLPRALSRGRFQELAPAWVEAWLHDLGLAAEEVRSRPGAPGRKPTGPRRGKPGPRPGGGGPRQPDPMNSTASYFSQNGNGLRRGGQAPGRSGGNRQPDPMNSTVNYIAQDPNGPRRGRPNGNSGAGGYGNSGNPGNAGNGQRGNPRGKPGRPNAGRQPDPMSSTVHYIAQDPNGMRRGPGRKPGGGGPMGSMGGGGNKPGRSGGSRQPDPMTSTVNYIARGQGPGSRLGGGMGLGGFRRPKGRSGPG